MIVVLWIAYGFLAIGFAAICIKHCLLKKDIKQLGCKLDEIIRTDTNANLRTDTFDADIISLIQTINKTLDKSRRDYNDAKQIETDLKRAITNISHDLRTPLTSAKGYLQMAESGGLDDETMQRYIGTIRGRLDDLTILMDSLFAFSRAIEASISPARVNVSNVLRDALSGSYAEIESKGFEVESHIPDAPVYFLCDEDALKRVTQNLITNAIVHGKQYLSVRLSEGQIEISNKADRLNLIDTHDIFERFYTADTSRANKRTGLGLAIAKELTEKMGGQISATKDGDMLVMRVCLPPA